MMMNWISAMAVYLQHQPLDQNARKRSLGTLEIKLMTRKIQKVETGIIRYVYYDVLNQPAHLIVLCAESNVIICCHHCMMEVHSPKKDVCV